MIYNFPTKAFLWALLVLSPVQALGAGTQLEFSEVTQADGSLRFHYSVSDHRHPIPWHLDFVLPSTTVREQASALAHLDSAALVARVNQAVTAALEHYHGLARAEVKPYHSGYTLSLRSVAGIAPIKQVANEASEAAARAANGFYYESYFKQLKDKRLMPDYARLAAHYIDAMAPVAQAVARAVPTGSERDRLAAALAFMQSIPYDDFTLVTQQNGYSVPTAVLVRNKGDCGSKSVALASLLATLMPNVKTVIVIIPGHALMAATIPGGPSDHHMHYEGRDYLLMEPVGPGMLPPGQISPRTRAALASNRDVLIMPVSGP